MKCSCSLHEETFILTGSELFFLSSPVGKQALDVWVLNTCLSWEQSRDGPRVRTFPTDGSRYKGGGGGGSRYNCSVPGRGNVWGQSSNSDTFRLENGPVFQTGPLVLPQFSGARGITCFLMSSGDKTQNMRQQCSHPAGKNKSVVNAGCRSLRLRNATLGSLTEYKLLERFAVSHASTCLTSFYSQRENKSPPPINLQ